MPHLRANVLPRPARAQPQICCTIATVMNNKKRRSTWYMLERHTEESFSHDVESPLVDGVSEGYGSCQSGRNVSTSTRDGGGGASKGGSGSRNHFNPDGDGSFEDNENTGRSFFFWPMLALKRYMRFLDEAPLLTKVFTSGLLGALSDVIAQVIENSGRSKFDGLETPTMSLDWQRVLALSVVGMVLTAPMFHFLYDLLEHVIPSSAAGLRSVKNVTAQLVVDQLVAAPLWVVSFYGLFSVAENGRVALPDIVAQIQRDFVPTMKLTWMIFPVFQVISFGFLPKKMRVLVLNVVDLGYTAALSYIKHR